MRNTPWTSLELNILKSHYKSQPFAKWLHLLPNRSKTAIKLKANSIHLYRQTQGLDVLSADISVLLKEDHQSYYWIGFLLADGHFSKTNRLQLRLALKDENHLLKFGKFIKYRGSFYRNNQSASINIMDGHHVPLIKAKFGILSNKTYKPPIIKIFRRIPYHFLISLLIGFIDGDGAIRPQSNRSDCFLSVKNHRSWLKILSFFRDVLIAECGINFPETKIEGRGYALLTCCNMNILKFLKHHGQHHQLPLMNRKWDQIDLNRISMYDIAKTRIDKVLDLRSKGLKYQDISAIVGISLSRISRIIHGN